MIVLQKQLMMINLYTFSTEQLGWMQMDGLLMIYQTQQLFLFFLYYLFYMYRPDIREGMSFEISGRVLQMFKINFLSCD